MALELSDMTLEEALWSNSLVKGHRTRVEKEIGNLLRLLTNNYSATSEERLSDRLEKLEKHTHKLSDIAEYLITLKYAKARDHRNEVADFKEVLDKCSEEVFPLLHERHSAPAQAPAQLMFGRPQRTSLPSLPSQNVPIALDKRGIVVSVRPDRLSYVIKVDNRFFTHPRGLLRSVTPDTPFPVVSSTPPSSPPLRRSL